MTMTVLEQNTGYGVYNPGVGTFRWNGHSFNPTGDTSCGYQTLNGYTLEGINYSVTTYNPTTSFDLSGYQYGNEVVAYFVKFENPDADTKTGTCTLNFKDPYGNIIYTGDHNFSLPQNYWYCCWIGIGIKEYPNAEINGNGTYTANYTISWSGGSVSGTKAFTVTNYPSVTTSTNVGALWVEGDNLCYICNQRRKISIKHDGTASYVGTDYSGSIWLEDNGKITYIDSSGYKRKTKLGDKYGAVDTTELPMTPGTSYKGTIWVSHWFFDVYIMIISADGVSYRIGPGYVNSGDYQ